LSINNCSIKNIYIYTLISMLTYTHTNIQYNIQELKVLDPVGTLGISSNFISNVFKLTTIAYTIY